MAASLALAAALIGGTHAQQASSLEALPVHGQVTLVTGGGANALVQVGSQGVLVVDTLTEALADSLLASIRAIAGAKPIGYVVNTHAHPDHTGGNLKVAAAGAQLVSGNFAAQLGGAGTKSAFIVAHENVLNVLSGAAGGPAAPTGAWPTDTFFQDEKTMYYNGEGIELIHEPSAHTDGDILVFFRSSDVIAAGDVFDTTAFPRIDLARKGSVNGVIEALNRLIDLAISEQFTEGGTRIVPGHGRIVDEFDVVEYRDMMTIVRDRVQAMQKKGMTAEQVVAAHPAFEYEPRFARTTPQATVTFIESIYRTLK
jgi:glyoxylase-like metal-dependent hydrolase (beta-lactamase superfamily II)